MTKNRLDRFNDALYILFCSIVIGEIMFIITSGFYDYFTS